MGAGCSGQKNKNPNIDGEMYTAKWEGGGSSVLWCLLVPLCIVSSVTSQSRLQYIEIWVQFLQVDDSLKIQKQQESQTQCQGLCR